MMKRYFIALMGLSLVVSAQADVAYSSLGQNPNGYGYYVGGNGYSPAEQFTSLVSGSLSSIQLVIGNNDGSTNPQPFQISLLADNVGTPGSVLGTWAESTDQSFWNYVTQSYSTTGPSLVAGQNYWLLLVGYNTDAASCVRWAGTYDSTANLYDYNPGGDYVQNGALNSLYQVQTTPEPGSVAVLGLGALGLLIRRKRK